MIFSLFDKMEQCTEEEVSRLLPSVTAQRREQALRYRHTFGRFACLKSYEMLCELTGKKQLVFRYSQHGKPLLQDYPELHFNISHCKNALLVAVDDKPVGADVESFRTVSDALLQRCMNPVEAGTVRDSACPEEAFASLWTRKEAVLKLRGTGLTDDLHNVLSGPEKTETHLCRAKHYAYSFASF